MQRLRLVVALAVYMQSGADVLTKAHPLQANMARAYLLDSVPSDVAEMCRLQNGCFREAFLEMLQLVYTDQVLPVAEASERGAWECVRPADKQVWAQLPQGVQRECRAFVTVRAIEQENVRKTIDVRLRSFARDFFVDANVVVVLSLIHI